MNDKEASVMDGRLVSVLGDTSVMGIADSGYSNYTLKQMKTNRLWKEGIDGSGLVVGVVDTGIFNHEMLDGVVIDGKNFSDDKRGEFDLTSKHYHATAVCSLISGHYMNRIAYGLTNAKIILSKSMNDNGTGSVESIANGINYLVDMKVDAINCSVGSTYSSTELENAVRRAVDNNIPVICSSGNDNKNGESVSLIRYPGAYPESVVVGSIDESYNISSYSNGNMFIDFVQGGEDLVCAYGSSNANNLYAVFSGTSFSCPCVTSAIILLKDKFIKDYGRKPTESELFGMAMSYVRKIEGVNLKLQGHGYIDFSINRTKKLK